MPLAAKMRFCRISLAWSKLRYGQFSARRVICSDTHLTRSRRMISSTSCVSRSSKPVLESPAIMFAASMSKLPEDKPASACSANVERGV